MKRLLLLAAIVAALVFAAAGTAATQHAPRLYSPPLHRYEHGPRVRNLQWILKGHKPSAHRKLKTYHGRLDGHYGPKTARAVRLMKYLLGFPNSYLGGKRGRMAGPYFQQVLRGKVKRPFPWIARAGKRQARYFHNLRLGTSTTACQKRVIAYARSQIGVKEIPLGSNTGPIVTMFQSVTGAYRAPWCVSFVQWVLWRAHEGPIANRTAGAVYLRDWAYSHGLLRSKPEPGTVAVWIYSDEHASIVESVHGTAYTTIDGNWSDQVMRVQRDLRYGPPVAFIYLPHCS